MCDRIRVTVLKECVACEAPTDGSALCSECMKIAEKRPDIMGKLELISELEGGIDAL